MINWEKALVPGNLKVFDALRVLDLSATQILVVVDSDNRLLGTVTDGDIRRGILAGFSLEDRVESIMNKDPVVVDLDVEKEKVLSIMKKRKLHQVPVVDRERKVVGLQVVDDFIRTQDKPNWVVLMAGGLGTRLRPLTDDCPKPLLKVGSKPVLELILEGLVKAGFSRFYLSVNYKAEQIRDYFGDGSRWDVTIRYLNEQKKLGTAGSLGLIGEPPAEPMLVMNGDLLTSINFGMLLDFHREHGAVATMCVREYRIQVPFGVVKVDRHRLASIVEKPVERFFVNAGIYVLEPEVLESIERNTCLDMPELFDRLVAGGRESAVFPLHEDWLDIGRHDDLELATRKSREQI